MATIATLKFVTALDSAGLSSGLRGSGREIDQFLAANEKRLRSLPTPQLAAPSVAPAVASQAQELAAALVPVAGQVKQAVWAAVQPLTQFAAKFGAQFDKVGGALIGISERIDEHMKFPKFEERIQSVRQKVRRTFGLVPKDVHDAAGKAGAEVPHLDPFARQFGQAAEQIRVSVLPIPEHVRAAVRQAEAVRANLGPLVGDFENAARRVQDAIVPPSDGKGYNLDRGARSRAAQAQHRVGGRFAKKDGGDTFAPTPATADQLPARVHPTAPVVTGQWHIEPIAAQLQSGGKAAEAAGQQIGALSKIVRNGLSVFGPYGQAAATGLAVATGAVQVGATTIGGSMRVVGRTVDLGLAAWLKWEKLKGFLGSLGSVAERTIGKINAIKPPPFKFDLSTTINQITKVGAAASAATAPVVNFGKSFAVGLGLFGAAFKSAEFVKDGVKEAVALNETMSATTAILGNATPAVAQFADRMAADFGLLRRETLETAQGFGGMAKGLGEMTGPALAKFSTDMTQLAADLSSFKNMDMKDASEALRVTLSGEQSDALKKMGVIINETTTKQYALAHGIGKVGDELTEQQKFLARAGQLTEGLRDAAGDLGKTQGEAANQYRKLTGSITNVGAAMGQALLPILKQGLLVLNKVIAAGGNLFEGSKGSIEGFSAVVAGALSRVEQIASVALPVVVQFGGGLVTALGRGVVAVYNLLPSFEQVVDYGQRAFAAVSQAVVGLYHWITNIPTALDGAFGAGTFALVVKWGAIFAGVALAIGTLGPILAGVAATVGVVVSSCLSWVPVVAAVGTAVLAVVSQYVSLQDVVANVGWALRNAGDLAGVAWLYVVDKANLFLQTLAAVPKMAATVATYIRDNWLTVLGGVFGYLISTAGSAVKTVMGLLWAGFQSSVSLVAKALWEIPGIMLRAVTAAGNAIAGFFTNIWGNLKSFGAAIIKFVRNPTQGFDWNLPELKLPEIKTDGSAEIDKRLAAIAEKERAFQASAAAPPALAAPAVAQVAPPPVAAADVALNKAVLDVKAATRAQTELESFAKQFKNKVATPMEEYAKKMEMAQKAFDQGLLSQEEFGRAQQFAKHEAGLDKEVKVAGAVELGSKEANSSVVSALAGRQGGIANVERINQQQLDVQRKQLEEAKKANKGRDRPEAPKQVHI